MGEKGRRIRELTALVQKRFKFPDNSLELYAEKVQYRGLSQCKSLRDKLLGGRWAAPALPVSPQSPAAAASTAMAPAPLPPVQQLVLAHAPYHPIDTYALAARHGLDGAAVAASGHLLAFDLSLVTDALATAMGPVYLKRLFLLHQARRAALREILLRAPARAAAHPPCDGRALLREWALVTASLVWDVTPGEWFVFVNRGLGTGG